MTALDDAARSIGGFRIVETRTAALIARLAARRADGLRTELLFANANFILRCRSFVQALSGPDTLIVNDGIGIDLASWMLHRRTFVENLNGTDFTPRFLASLDRPTRLFLLGARPESIDGAAAVWSRLPFVEIVGTADGYRGMAEPDRVIARIREAAPDVLLVALGDPRQARWMIDERMRHGVPTVIGVGALFDFVSGRVSRAPDVVRRLRLEWLYRLGLEPRRLLKRYSIDLVAFFVHCLRVHRRERRARASPQRAA